MAGSVTVPGTGSGQITYTFTSGAGLTVAQQIAAALATAGTTGTLSVTSSSSGGNVASPTNPNVTNELVLTGSNASSVPAGYGYISNTAGGSSTINAASGTAILSSTGGGLFTETGPATIAAAGGNNVISQTGAGAINLAGGSGANTISAAGTSGTVSGGTGTDVMSVTGSNETIVSTGTDTITTGAGTGDTVNGTGSVSLTFLGGSGTATVLGGAGTNNVTAGSGGVVFGADAGSTSTVNAGTGTVTIFGATGSDVNLTGAGTATTAKPDYAVAGPGSETLNASGSTGNVWLSVNTTVSSSSVTMNAGSGNDTLIAGSAPGSVTMTGGSGSDAFVFFKQAAGGAKDVINNFTANDSVFIEGYAAGSAAALQAAATVGTGGVTLTLSDGTSVTFSNLTSASQLNGKIQYG
jgi:Ca2+-binding RTX toxin-like protein